jgi:hypothetical protein
MVFFFLSVRRPEGSTREKLAKVDWVYVNCFLAPKAPVSRRLN